MEFHADTLDQIFAHDFDDLIDVRSPSEFADDHLPSAMNLPCWMTANAPMSAQPTNNARLLRPG